MNIWLVLSYKIECFRNFKQWNNFWRNYISASHRLLQLYPTMSTDHPWRGQHARGSAFETSALGCLRFLKKNLKSVIQCVRSNMSPNGLQWITQCTFSIKTAYLESMIECEFIENNEQLNHLVVSVLLLSFGMSHKYISNFIQPFF